jgi:putative glutamine amidotransferase
MDAADRGAATGGYRPLIAVVAYHLAEDRVPRWPAGGFGVPAPYLDALRLAGTRSALLAPGEHGEPEELLEPFDGLLLVGGGDIDPSRYGAAPDLKHNYGIEIDRDETEIALLQAADRMHLPTLCICRGMQVMNVAFGGTLQQHLPDLPGLLEHGVPLEGSETVHEVTPVRGSLLSAATKSGPLTCSSHHHQGVDRVGDGLRIAGTSSDGLVEAIELPVPDLDTTNVSEAEITWMLGVQWHPEETAETDPAQQSLFDALALLAKGRGSRARPGHSSGRSREYGLVDHDPAWPERFAAEAERIVQALEPELVERVDHVGSTSVPGLAAKPIVDIQLSLVALTPRDAYVGPLQGLGYRWVVDPWDDQHEYFSLDQGGERRFQIHVCLAGGEWQRRHLAFRDALRREPETAAAYERLKRELAAAHPRDIMAYVDGKTPFIREVEARALVSTRTSPQEPGSPD